MKRKTTIFLFTILSLLCIIYTNSNQISIASDKIEYKSTITNQDLLPGTYTTTDGHSLTIDSSGTIKYENTYTLTLKKNESGPTITGKVGTNNANITLYQLNSTTLINKTTITYTHNNSSIQLYEYTIFNMSQTPVINENGQYEIYRESSSIGKYNTLQEAVDASASGDTIKILKSTTISDGVYIKNKKITIDGNNTTLTREKSSNSVIVVEYNANVTLKNLTIDGNSTGFKVDYDSVTYKNYTIPLEANSQTNDVKLNLSTIITKGIITTDNITISNMYTATNGAGIYILSGKVTINKSNFFHNNANNKSGKGGAIFAGRNFKNGETSYSISKISISNSKINNNYTGHGAGIYLYNVDKIEITNSEFLNNTADGGKGGALNIDGETTTKPKAESLGLDYTDVIINNTTFDNNWAGNDGFAIQSYEGNLDIKNSLFKRNTGVHPTSSVGTISVESYRVASSIKTYIDNTTFEKNIGPCSVYGDHSTRDSTVIITNSTFKENEGNEAILLYSSVTTIKNSSFINDKSTLAAVDARIYQNWDIKPSLVVDSTTFSGGLSNKDILIRKQKHDSSLNDYAVTIKGITNANIGIWDNNKVTVEGTLTGNIETDGDTPATNFIVKDNALHNGKVISNENTYTFIIYYPANGTTNAYSTSYIPKDKTTITDAELFLFHNLTKDGYKLEYYEDSAYKNKWDYSVTGHLVLYSKWIEHTHDTISNLIVHNNKIYDQCECGKLLKEISMSIPKNITYDGNKKEVEITNTIGAKETDYKTTYYKKESSGLWIEMTTSPTEPGNYKATLTYSGLQIEHEYTISKEPEKEEQKQEQQKDEQQEEKEQNPNTGTHIYVSSILLLTSIALAFYYFQKHNKKIFKI